MTRRQRVVLSVLAAVVALLAGVFVVVVATADDIDERDRDVTSASTTSTAVSTSTSTSTTTAPATTTTTSAPPTTAVATTGPPAAAPTPLTGAGAVLSRPVVPELRRGERGRCESLATEGWTARCAQIRSSSGPLTWLIETRGPSTHALVLRPAAGTTWQVVLSAEDSSGQVYDSAGADAADLDGDGADEIAFGFRLRGGERLLQVDVVDGSRTVVLHRDLTAGSVRLSQGQLDEWELTGPGSFQHGVIRHREGGWRLVASSTVEADDVPPSQI